MKKKFTFLMAALMLLTMMVLPNRLLGTTVTFVAGTDTSSELSITKDGITISFSSGTFSRSDNYRCYSSATMSVSSSVGTITEVKLTCTGSGTSDYGPGKFSGTDYSYSGTTGTWSNPGNGKLTASAQVRMTQIVVTYTPAYTITAQSNNTNYGTVSLSGSVITGSPNSGYQYANPAYSVSPANSATVSQNGNAFTVTPSANTTITINFEAIPTYTVTMPTSDEYGNYTMDATNPVAYGTTVNLTYDPASGHEDDNATWSVNGEAISGNSFTMPDDNVTVTVSVTPYVQPKEFDISLNNSLFGTTYGGSVSGITDDNPVIGTQDNVTVTYAGSGNHYINNSQIRFYPSNKLTFEAPTGYVITKIVFTADGTWAATITANSGTYTSSTKTWTGSATSVLFTGSGSSRCDMSKATITLAEKVAPFTNGVYTESLTTQASFNNMIVIDNIGEQIWQFNSSNNYVEINSTNSENNDWLITPKMAVSNGQLAISFKTNHDSDGAGHLTIKYSANIKGPWTNISFTEGSAGSFNNNEARITTDAEAVYVAFVYIATNTSSGQWEIKDFTAKQCYSIIYDANYTNGSSVSYGPYAVGEEVMVRANDGDGNPNFEIPDDKVFSHWNTDPDGISGTTYHPTTSSVTISTEDVTLYAFWTQDCNEAPEMDETTYAYAYVNNNGVKSWTVTFKSQATALGDCDIYDYGFVYSSTVSSDDDLKIGEEGCIKESVGESPTVNTEFNYPKTGVAARATIYVRSYAINPTGPAYGAVATITTEAFPTYTISYTTNGHAEGTTTYVDQGDAISGLLTTPTAAYIPAGYTFMGWYNGNYALNNTAPTYVQNGNTIENNLTLRAVFALAGTNEETVDASLVIVPTDFTSNGYAANDGDHVKSDITYNTNNVYMQSANDIQFKSNSGYLYNKTPLDLTSITLSNISQGAFTVYAGTQEHPSETSISGQNNVYTISNNTYFTIKGGANTPRVGTITINYTKTQTVTTYSNYCTSVSVVSLGKDLTIDGDLNVTNYTLTVPSGKKLTVNGTLTNNGTADNLIIQNGGQLVLSNSNTGVKATMQKTVSSWAGDKGDADGWYAISSPVNNIAIADFVKGGDNGHNVYRYDEPTRYWNEYRSDVNVAPYLEPFTNLDNGCGYLYRSTETGINFKGDVNVGSATYTLKYTDKSDNMNGFNLIGNPYSHNIFKGASTAAISNTYEEETILENDAYFFDTEKGEWILLKDGTAIAPTQAILVQAKTNTTLSIVNSTAGYVAQGDKYANDNIWFTVKNSEYYDDACVRFKKGRGLNKVEHRNDLAPMLYIIKEGEDFASANMPDNTSVINIGFDAKTMGQYTFSLKAEGRYSYMHLIDKLTGEDVDMLIEDSYTFMGSPRDRKDRFVLRLNYNAAGIDTESDIFAYQSGSDIIVSGEGELQIFDVMGRMVMNQRINGVQTINGINNGVYIFKLEGKTQKIVVR